MGKINILDKTITNRISAGEVVEKPASIVKELLENSIDAGATRIVVEIKNGGIEKIAVTDDGVGIAKEDITLTIMPHATSKINAISDLDEINTLGFRGEALASISSVSRLEIISKTSADELGQKLVADGGDITHQTEIACPTGTHIEVNSLFFNTPVRAKFLRSPKSEQADITDYIERIMLAYPNIAFKYIIDGKIKYNTTSSSLENIIYTIYGKETLDGLVKINKQFDDFIIKGYIGKPEISKPNRNYQTLFISGRYVKNFMISSAIGTAYDSFLMKQKFPFYVLDLIVPANTVDVNVHPNKLEVKFEKPNQIYSAFHKAVLQTLLDEDQTRTIDLLNDKHSDGKQEDIDFANTKQNVELSELTENLGVSYKDRLQTETPEQTNLFNNLQTNLKEQDIETEEITLNKSGIMNKLNSMPTEVFVQSTASNEVNKNDNQQKSNQALDISKYESQNNSITKQEQEIKAQSVYDVIDYKIVGTIFQTYNIIQSSDFVYFIDQHAAHERILYDKYINEIKTEQVMQQQLLMPYILKVKDVESIFLNQQSQTLNSVGFQIEEFGFNTFKISAIPYIFSNLKINEFFDDFLKDYNEYNKHPNDYLKNMIATKACKSAVKAGQNLTELEIKTIFETMKKGILQCPHGRPFVLKLDKLQVEKWFKRVL
jgi:DNA mismatch repair protein MutL